MADFDTDLGRQAANFAALTPIDFLLRAEEVYPEHTAVIHGDLRQTWAQTAQRCRQLAAALRERGLGRSSTVAALLPNTPAMVEAHFGVPMAGAVLNALNIRLDVETLIYILQHGEAEVLLADSEFEAEVAQIKQALPDLYVVQVNDVLGPVTAAFGEVEYEVFLQAASDANNWILPADEWDAIALNYTSGTTGKPKGVVYSHRNAVISALSMLLDWNVPLHPVYLATLPMFHCNAWCYPWSITAKVGTFVCLRRFEPTLCLDLIREHKVTHYAAAPIVHAGLANAPAAAKAGIEHVVHGTIAGAAPPAALLEAMEEMGFEITHVYGLTEVYGPATICERHQAWNDLSIEERAALNARQGVRSNLVNGFTVMDAQTMSEVPADGETMGELMIRGNHTMKGYLKNPQATAEAFADGWFHTGDLGVKYPDGYIQIKDRSKDIIISGGENISSIEVEDVLYKHPAVLTCAVVAAADAKWGEVPMAFVELREGQHVSADELNAYCLSKIAKFKVPKHYVFEELPKTSTGKIQKFMLRKRAKEVLLA
ncbi:AMP-binding protein [Vitreoscilla massiliensis]|uniref:AMP-binding protein n=1 Tax=Vitreoscilla massiliensis TaxID=1689272 RepID=A0ABY4E1A2_9NEIS|nr:AMP-binding protein [Vitreoscilla massiliensis]UOO88098.1 AMP-binding protein [Vitreoscilla massiliensis]